MKTKTIYIFTCLLALSLFYGCESEEEQQPQQTQVQQETPEQTAQQQARQDSLQRIRQQRMQQQRKEKADPDIFDPEARIASEANGNYVIQVGSWRSKDKAQKLAAEWQSLGFENAYVVKFGNEETGNVWFRVRLGHSFSKQETAKLQTWLQKNYQAESWVMYIE